MTACERRPANEAPIKTLAESGNSVSHHDVPPPSRRTEVEQARALLLLALGLLTPAVRCRRCDHPLSAETSVRRGIGPECRRREAAGLLEVTR